MAIQYIALNIVKVQWRKTGGRHIAEAMKL